LGPAMYRSKSATSPSRPLYSPFFIRFSSAALKMTTFQ
jgi:hypothetical protein